MHVAIIGAGAAGLTSARHVSAQGIQCEVYEMAAELGGTWVYTDDVDKDQYGYPVHTAMYQGLRANLPKEIMGFPDFPIPKNDESFLCQKDILDFLNLYADHFNIRKIIKFNEMVTDIRPFDDKWQITSIHKPSKKETINFYDVVMVCNGHYNTPITCSIPGEEKFKGTIIHSHKYRSLEPYKNRRVLVIGAGPSGMDLALHISTVAKSVVLSHDPVKREIKSQFPMNVSKKPEVVRINNEEEVEFVDGTCCSFDAIIYCTGYKYSFPFLHSSCGIKVQDKRVNGLYKHMIHIEKPSMVFIGIPIYVCAFQMFDLQARFYCQYLNGSMSLPSKEMMWKDVEEDMKKRKEKGYSSTQVHLLGHHQQEYYSDLAAGANITPIAKVMTKIWSECDETSYNDVVNFRNQKFRIVNNDTFVKM